MSDWNPAQYDRFARERRQPFDDLLALVRPVPGGRVVDLGCGTGELTRELHAKLGAGTTLGVDASEAMLARAKSVVAPGLSFVRGRIEDAPREHPGPFDVVFSNAALHWLPDFRAGLRALVPMIAKGGQLAVQIPQNFDHVSHETAEDVAREPRFRDALAGYTRPRALVAPELVAADLFELGFDEERVRLEVYPHKLAARRDVVEWVKGTLLTDYEKRLSPEDFKAFLARYTELVVPRLGARDPYLFAFKRLLLWAKLP